MDSNFCHEEKDVSPDKNVDVLNRYFGYTIHNLRGKPTNSEFIAMIADKMRLDKRQRVG